MSCSDKLLNCTENQKKYTHKFEIFGSFEVLMSVQVCVQDGCTHFSCIYTKSLAKNNTIKKNIITYKH